MHVLISLPFTKTLKMKRIAVLFALLLPLFLFSQDHLRIGKDYMEAQELDLAIETFSKGLAENPKSVDLLVERAIAYEYKQEYSAAGEDYKTALSIDANHSKAWFEKSRFEFYSLRTPDNAFKSVNKAISLEKKGEYYFYRGIYYYLLQDRLAAIDDYKKALEHGEETAQVYTNLSAVHAELQRYEQAYDYLEKSIEKDPNYLQSYSNGIYLSMATANPAKLCEFIAECERREVNEPFVPLAKELKICEITLAEQYGVIGEIMFIRGEYKAAIPNFSLAMKEETTPNYKNVMNRGRAYYMIEDYFNAEKDYAVAMEMIPDDSADARKVLYKNMLDMVEDQQKYDEVMKYCEKILSMDPNDKDAILERGHVYMEKKDYESALEDFDKILKMDPGFHRALGYRASLHLQKGDFQKAYDDAWESTLEEPAYGYGYYILGMAKLKLDKAGYCLEFEMALEYGYKKAQEELNKNCK